MLELKSKSKLVFLLVMIFIVTFSICLIVFAANETGSYYRLDLPWLKLCDYSISSNLPVARYDGANEWLLQSNHTLSIQSYGRAFDYRFGWGHGWCPVGDEGSWTNCDEKLFPPPQPRSINANSSASHSYYGWWYDEYADVNQYKAISASIFKPERYAVWAGNGATETRVVNR